MYEPRHLLERILEAAIMLAIAAWLIRLAVTYIISVRVALLIIAAVILLIVAGVRLYRYFGERNNWREPDDRHK